jgi:hypothetical protein
VQRKPNLSVDYCRNGILNVCRAVGSKEVIQSLPLQLSVDVWIPNIEPQPGRISHVVSARARMRRVKIDKGGRHSIHEHTIARTGISVTNDLAATPEIAIRRCVVHRPQQARGRRQHRT